MIPYNYPIMHYNCTIIHYHYTAIPDNYTIVPHNYTMIPYKFPEPCGIGLGLQRTVAPKALRAVPNYFSGPRYTLCM